MLTSGSRPKEKTGALKFDAGSHNGRLQQLILSGFLDQPVTSEDIVGEVWRRFGDRWQTKHIQIYMKNFMKEEIVQVIRPEGQRINYWVLTSMTREEALRATGKTFRTLEMEEQLFSPDLSRRLEKDFDQELKELHSNFGRNAMCSAFLLRKILEKLLIIVLLKHGKDALIEDKARPGQWVGLESLIDIAAREKLNSVPFLLPKTANAIKGIKFLGDTAAHNPLVRVDNQTILPQMPYIITAYNELARLL